MKTEQFKEIVTEQHTMCCNLLGVKEQIYSDGLDRLVQFKTAAELLGCSPTFALAGMMVKHTTKLFQMMHDSNFGEGPKQFSAEQWNETLSDSINYHYLLRAVIAEEGAV